jgi:hypothetical protein
MAGRRYGGLQRGGREAAVKKLLEEGADVESKDRSQRISSLKSTSRDASD